MTAILGKFTKQPGEKLDYDIDFTEWFAGRSDTPASYVVVAETGITVESDSRSGNVVKVVLSGGTSGVKYKITILLTTTSGLVKEVDFTVAVKAV